jgi:hypothetical protein
MQGHVQAKLLLDDRHQDIDALDARILPDINRLRERFKPDPTAVPDIAVDLVPLTAYDALATVGLQNDLVVDGGAA